MAGLSRQYNRVPFASAIQVNYLSLTPDKIEDRSANTEKAALKATLVGGLMNVFLALSKGSVGLLISSTGMIADAANSAGDVLTDIVVYISVIKARTTATPDRPWGMGKLEPMGALTVGGLLLLTGTGIGYASLASFVEIADALGDLPPIFPGSPLTNVSISELTALSVCTVSVAVKEFLFRYTLQHGSAANSAVVIANAWQHRADAFVSTAVLIGLVGGLYGFPLMDPLAGLFVATLIVKQGFTTAFESLKDLSDAPISQEEVTVFEKTALGVRGVQSIVKLQGRKSGPFVFVECTVGVPATITASAAHRLGELVRLRLLEKHKGRVANAVVDVDPLGATGLGHLAPHAMRDHDVVIENVVKAVFAFKPDKNSYKKVQRPEDEQKFEYVERKNFISLSKSLDKNNSLDKQLVQHVWDVQVFYDDDGGIGVQVDVSMDPDLTIAQAHRLSRLLRKHILSSVKGLTRVDVDLELFEDSDAEDDGLANRTIVASKMQK